MEPENNKRSRIIAQRLTLGEYKQLEKGWKASKCRKLSDYARHMLLAEPVIAGYHNQSLDDFMTGAIRLRKELNSIGNNLNQAAKKLHSLQQIAEFRPWIEAFNSDYEMAIADIAYIKKIIEKISDSWLQ